MDIELNYDKRENKWYIARPIEGVAYSYDFEEINMPMRRIVCPRCDGRGVHDHPAFSDGITQSEWQEYLHDDPDFGEDYMSGRYDVRCSECRGKNVVEVVDEEGLSPEMQEALAEYWREEQALRDMHAAERRMGA
jgi:hypothetical protein